jgi:hypothetical protein
MNPDFVTDIKASKEPLGMTTNAGTKKRTMECHVDGFGKAWYDPNQIANIFGFSHMVDKSKRIVYDSKEEDAFKVYMKHHGMVKFKQTPEGLPSKEYVAGVAKQKGMMPLQEVDCMVSTLEENKKNYMQRQF